MKKFLKSIFIVFVFYLAFISCESGGKENVPGGAVNDVGAAGTEIDAGTKNPAEELYFYPEHDFENAAVNILSRKDGWAGGSQDLEDLSVQNITGEIFNDTVYKRTKTVEEKYNVKINMTYVPDVIPAITKSIKAGDDEYQIIQEKLMFMSSNLAALNYLTDLKTVAAMNLDAPWYNQNAIRDLSINNKVTVLGGDMTINDKSGVILAAFNKKMAVQYGLENLYATVREGKWTLDKLYELMVQTTADLNGDGQYKVNDDQWGLVSEDYGGWMLSAASGNRLAALDDAGIPYMTVVNEKTVADYGKIMKIMYEKQGRATVAEDEAHVRIFYENRCFITIDMLSQFPEFRGMEEDFGIIPLPKQDENQKEYITTISPWQSRFVAIPSTCKNPEMTGAVIDAMSRESMDTIAPAYYDNLLNQKIARDDESIEMLKQIFGSIIYDIGSVFNWAGIWDLQHQYINQKKEDYSGFYEVYQGKVEAALEKTIAAMNDGNN
jgi:hypothetical protein